MRFGQSCIPMASGTKSFWRKSSRDSLRSAMKTCRNWPLKRFVYFVVAVKSEWVRERKVKIWLTLAHETTTNPEYVMLRGRETSFPIIFRLALTLFPIPNYTSRYLWTFEDYLVVFRILTSTCWRSPVANWHFCPRPFPVWALSLDLPCLGTIWRNSLIRSVSSNFIFIGFYLYFQSLCKIWRWSMWATTI